MWGQLPVGAARNWGELASRTPQGVVQVANIVYERQSRPQVQPVVEAFFKFLEGPSPTVASGYSRLDGLTAIEYADLEQQAVNQVETFVATHRDRGYHIACPEVDAAQFSIQAVQGRVCRFASHHKSITSVSLHCQVNLRPSRPLARMTKEFYESSSNFGVLSAAFLDEIDRRAPRAQPNNLYATFYSFSHSVNAHHVDGCNAATTAVVVTGLSDYDPGVEIARIEFEVPNKPSVCRRPSVFSSEGNAAFCAFDPPDTFGRTRVLGTGDEGVPEFVLLASNAPTIVAIVAIGAVEPPKRAPNANKIREIIRAMLRP
jgi:hypothetical protein